jgi:hypothetical protein
MKRRNETTEPRDASIRMSSDLRPRYPIEPDPMNPAPTLPADIEPKPSDRPDLDWTEHED